MQRTTNIEQSVCLESCSKGASPPASMGCRPSCLRVSRKALSASPPLACFDSLCQSARSELRVPDDLLPVMSTVRFTFSFWGGREREGSVGNDERGGDS